MIVVCWLQMVPAARRQANQANRPNIGRALVGLARDRPPGIHTLHQTLNPMVESHVLFPQSLVDQSRLKRSHGQE